MLLAALREPDPVILFEHAMLYAPTGELDEADGPAPISAARPSGVPGRDVTLVTFGGSLQKALAAAERLAGDGIDAEVIDLRALRPLDTATVLASVARTHRAVIVDEGWRTGSLAAEVSAQIMEGAFYELDGRSRGCAARRCRCPIPSIWRTRRCRRRRPSSPRCERTLGRHG